MKDYISLTAAQLTWAERGLYPGNIDGRWGALSRAANDKLVWLAAAQTYWRKRGWYPEKTADGRSLKIDGLWGAYSERAHAAHGAELNKAPVDETNLEQWRKAKVSDPARFEWAVVRMLRYQGRYEALGAELGIPWWFIGCLHCREASFNFETHLHNGDSLSGRTIHVPAGRPKAPPRNGSRYEWDESARDALDYEGFLGLKDWSVPAALDRFERFNGLGYQKRCLPSPYLWAGTNQYALTANDGLPRGKYVADGKFDPNYIDRQPGCAGILLSLGIR